MAASDRELEGNEMAEVQRRYFASIASVAALIFLFLGPGTAQAVLIEGDLASPGDKLLTRDTASGLVWLDLTQTVNLSVNQVLGGAGGFIAAGFQYATTGEVIGLYTAAGMPNVPGSSAANIPGVSLLLQLMGCTGDCGGGNPYAGGFTATPLGGAFITLSGIAQPSLCCIASNNLTNLAIGSYLVRPVPEPITLLLFGTGLVGIGIGTRRRSRKES